jgi:hypothetical protein
MNSNPHDPMTSESVLTPAEETLRLIANLPAPEGLEDRVHARVHAAASAAQHRGSVLAWPRAFRAESGWMRGAAAAAIVFVVAGGGWGVYTRVESTQNQPAKVIVMPARMPGSTGGLSGAGAMRPPLTLPGPAAPQAVKTSREASPAKAKATKNPVANGKTTSHGGHSAATTEPTH